MVNMTFSGMDNQKKELVNKSESAAKEKKKSLKLMWEMIKDLKMRTVKQSLD